jgi:hypothetical protein
MMVLPLVSLLFGLLALNLEPGLGRDPLSEGEENASSEGQ